MFGLRSFHVSSSSINALLEDFEEFCLGKKFMSPQQFSALNEELSIGAVLKVGKNRMERREDGNHLMWTAPDGSEHDMGPVDHLNVSRDYPGFHRARSLLLGQGDVVENDVIHVNATDKNISKVRMKDGSVGYGPNYKIALRNAVLRMHLKKEFKRANPLNLWKMLYGHA